MFELKRMLFEVCLEPFPESKHTFADSFWCDNKKFIPSFSYDIFSTTKLKTFPDGICKILNRLITNIVIIGIVDEFKGFDINK